MKRIHIFKTGTHTDSHGQTLSFSESDLAAAVSAYNPAIHQAPIVVGHPKTDAPAFGWVRSLSAEGDNLFATPEQLNTEFSEQVQAGSYKKVSASFYPPNSPTNPVKGVYYLRHVGFLGGQPPAIKGLQPIEFSESDDEVTVTLDFHEVATMPIDNQSLLNQLVTGLRSLFFGESTLSIADPATPHIPELKPEQKETSMTTPAPAVPAAPPVTPVPPATPVPQSIPDTTDKDAQIARLQQELDAKNKADAKAKADALAKDNSDFAEGLVSEHKIAPKDKALVTAILDGLDMADASKPIEFGEGDDKQPLKQAVKDKLKSANTDSFAYLFSEAAGKPDNKNDSYDYSEDTDLDRIELDQKIKAHAKANNLNYAEAAVVVMHS